MDDKNKHSLVHSEQSPHVCDTCGSRFSTKSSMQRHSLIHRGEKHYVCDTCGNRFSRKDNFESHCLIHRGEKTHVCDTCGSRFRTKRNLKSHSLIHTVETPYVCDTCGKQFKSISYLVSHRRVHTGEKPYSCSSCGKTFKYSSNFYKHVKKNCNKSHKIAVISAEVILDNNSENTSVSNPSLNEPAEETVEVNVRRQTPSSDSVTLFQDAMIFRQKSPSLVANNAKESSIPQNFGTFNDELNAPKRGGHLSSEGTYNVETQSKSSSESSELHGHFSKINDLITCNNLTLPVLRECSRENTLHPVQLEVSSWSVQEQASTSINASSASSSREFGESVACGFLPDNPSAAFVGWDYSEHNRSTSPKSFFDL